MSGDEEDRRAGRGLNALLEEANMADIPGEADFGEANKHCDVRSIGRSQFAEAIEAFATSRILQLQACA